MSTAPLREPAMMTAMEEATEPDKVHGWNFPMPLEGEPHAGVRIPPALLLAARKLAQGVASLTAAHDASGGFIPYTHIAAYMALQCEQYGTFDANITDDLMDALDNAKVIGVDQYVPEGNAPTEYLALFLIEPIPLP